MTRQNWASGRITNQESHQFQASRKSQVRVARGTIKTEVAILTTKGITITITRVAIGIGTEIETGIVIVIAKGIEIATEIVTSHLMTEGISDLRLQSLIIKSSLMITN